MDRNTFKIHEKEKIGEVRIADEVIATIATLAATEVQGIASMASDLKDDFIGLLGKKSFTKGVAVEVNENKVSLDLSIIIELGAVIADVSKNVQEKVANAIETMTGLTVEEVNVNIVSVNTKAK